MKYCVFLFALVALVASNTTLADSHSWSFAAHPHPRKFEYSDLQNRLWQTALQGWGNDVEICDDVLQAEFEVYKLEYPIFVFSELALERGCEEIWAATEAENIPARGLFRKMSADEQDGVVVYSWTDPGF